MLQAKIEDYASTEDLFLFLGGNFAQLEAMESPLLDGDKVQILADRSFHSKRKKIQSGMQGPLRGQGVLMLYDVKNDLPLLDEFLKDEDLLLMFPRLHPDLCEVSLYLPANSTDAASDIPVAHMQSTSHSKETSARIRSVQTLTAADVDRFARLLTLDITPDLYSSLQAGDCIGLHCENDPETVSWILDHLGLNSNQTLTISCSAESLSEESLLGHLVLNFGAVHSISAGSLISRHVDYMHWPKKAALRAFAEHCTDPMDRIALLFLSSKAGSSIYMQLASQHVSLLDVLSSFATCKPPLSALLTHCPLLHARFYSVCRFPFANQVDLLYAPIRFTVGHGDASFERTGVCSAFLNRQCENPTNLMLHLRPQPPPPFRLPSDQTTPIVFICAGTGISPFIGFLQQIKQTYAVVPPIWLIFGFRHRQSDCLFDREIRLFLKEKVLTRVIYAVSREKLILDVNAAGSACETKQQLSVGEEKNADRQMQSDSILADHLDRFYVQDAFDYLSEEIATLLLLKHQGAICICGEELNMVRGVNESIKKFIISQKLVDGSNPKELEKAAASLLNEWTRLGRVIRDVWI